MRRFQPFSALGNRNYRLFFCGQLISLTGTWLQQVAQGWLVYRLTDPALLLGLTTTIGSLPMLLLAVWGGVAADRYNKHRIVLFTQFAAMILALSLGLLALLGTITIWEIIIIAALLGVVNAFDIPARQAFVPEIVDRNQLMNAIALNSTMFNAARVVGPAVAGALIGQVGVAWRFLLNGLSYLAVIVGLLAMQLPPFEAREHAESVLAHARGGLDYVRRTPAVRALAALMSVAGVFGWSYAVLMPVFARGVLHGDAGTYGYLMSAAGIGALLGSLALASFGESMPRDAMVFGGLCLFSAAIVGFTLSTRLELSALLLAVGGASGIICAATSNTWVQTAVPDELRGRVMGIWSLIFAGAAPLGSLEVGTLAAHFGAPAAVRIGALICLMTTLFIALRSRSSLR